MGNVVADNQIVVDESPLAFGPVVIDVVIEGLSKEIEAM